MAASVAWKECYPLVAKRAYDVIIRWRAKRRCDGALLNVSERFDLIDAAAANDADANRVCHGALEFVCIDWVSCFLGRRSAGMSARKGFLASRSDKMGSCT